MKLTIEQRLAVLLLGVIAWLAIGPGPGVVLSAGEWFQFPGDLSTTVRLDFQFDTVAVGLLLIVVCVSLLYPGQLSMQQRLVGGAIFMLASAAVLLTDLVALLVVWTILAILLDAGRKRTAEADSSSLVLHLSSVCLLAALLVGAARYHTTDLLQLMTAASVDDRIDARSVAAGLSVWLAAATAIRCGVFPAILWLRGCVADDAHCRFRHLILATLLPGLAIVLRLMEASNSLSDGGILLAGLGALTTVIAGMIAVAQTQLLPTVALLAVASAASTCVACVAGGPAVVEIMLPSILTQLPLLAVVLALDGQSKTAPRVVRYGAVFVLCSGVAGPNAVVALLLVETQLGTISGSVAMGYPVQQFCAGVWTAMTIGQWLFGYALVKAVLKSEQTSPDSSATQNFPVLSLAVTVGVLATACVLPAHADLPARESILPSFAKLGLGTVALLIGAVSAWMTAGRESVPIPGIGSLARISQNWFYLPRVWSIAVSLPVRMVSLLVTAVDTHLISSGREEAWKYSLGTPATGLEHLRRAGAVFYGLSVVLLVVGLLFVLR